MLSFIIDDLDYLNIIPNETYLHGLDNYAAKMYYDVRGMDRDRACKHSM